jgi:hypothetical protein
VESVLEQNDLASRRILGQRDAKIRVGFQISQSSLRGFHVGL